MYRRIFTLVCFSVSLFLLAGCGKSKELADYRESMELFFQDAANYDAQMNAIDAQSEASVSELLNLLTGLEERFRLMAELPVPEAFAAAGLLADEASVNMTEAVTRYYQVYESERFDADAAKAAEEYYRLANQKVNEMIVLLRGGTSE